MKGTILGIDENTNTGVITGEDGRRYNFNGATWREQTAPVKGAEVDFDITGDNEDEADNVYLVPTMADTNPFAAPTTNLTQDNSSKSSQVIEEQNYSIIDWFKKCLRNYTNFSGRARRKEYWYFNLCYFGILIVASILDAIIFSSEIPVFYLITVLGLLLPSLAVTIRRLHDISRSGWWVLISFVPIFGSILLIVWLATETKPEVNEWGAPAK